MAAIPKAEEPRKQKDEIKAATNSCRDKDEAKIEDGDREGE